MRHKNLILDLFSNNNERRNEIYLVTNLMASDLRGVLRDQRLTNLFSKHLKY